MDLYVYFLANSWGRYIKTPKIVLTCHGFFRLRASVDFKLHK